MLKLAKILMGLVLLKGISFMVLPGFAMKSGEFYNSLKEKYRRIHGALILVIGFVFIILSRKILMQVLLHWVIVYFGIFMVLQGAVLVIVPNLMSKFIIWLFAEKGPLRAMGAIMFIAALVIYILL